MSAAYANLLDRMQDATPHNAGQAAVKAHYLQVFATLTNAPDDALIEEWNEFVEQWNECVEVITFGQRAAWHLAFAGRDA